tara:strand:- start:407 stop:802 length:396 start_codon:yes stop_codon:yes gene_type:complete
MKIHIWITTKDAMEGKLDPTNYYCQKPLYEVKDGPEYVQVSITPDEFTRLEDCNDFMHNQLSNWKSDYWLTEQYNRNREYKDQVKSVQNIFDTFPDYKDVTLEKFANWWGDMPEDKKEKFTEIFNEQLSKK